MIFLVALGQGGAPSWWLYSADGDVLAWAGRYFVSLAFAQQEASTFKSAASRAKYEIYPHSDGGWGWRALQPVDYYMAFSSGSYTWAAHARRAARKIEKRASGATVL